MAQEAAGATAKGLVILQAPRLLQKQFPDLWDAIQSDQLAKGQFHCLVA